MQIIIDSIKKSLDDENYFAALIISLTIPDICGKMENKKYSSSFRYIQWFDKYMKKYQDYLSGHDCYALRCAVFHEGSDDIAPQRIRKILDNFYLATKIKSHLSHLSNCSFDSPKIDGKEVLAISIYDFCYDFISSLNQWSHEVSKDKNVQENLKSMLIIHNPGDIQGFIAFE